VRFVNMYLDTVQMMPVQMKMARAALGWGVRELAEKAGLTANTVTRIENGSDAKQSTIAALRIALESAGVEFIAENGGGPGVRLKKRAKGLRKSHSKSTRSKTKFPPCQRQRRPAPKPP
jgi:transcriptional regulator with XRE-family HTH domain